MSQRLVSIVMPAYNAAATIERAIGSVLAQSWRHWELLVVDDASCDPTPALVKSLAEADPRIKLIERADNSGCPAVPRNIGIRQARGQLIAFLDADDSWDAEKLTRQLSAMVSSKAVLCCTGYRIVDKQGRQMGDLVPPETVSYAQLLRANSIGCSTAIYDVEQLGKRYFPELGHEDYALWLEILRAGHRATGIADILVSYQRGAGSVSANKFKVPGFFWRIYRREGFSMLRSAIYTLRYIGLASTKYRAYGWRGF